LLLSFYFLCQFKGIEPFSEVEQPTESFGTLLVGHLKEAVQGGGRCFIGAMQAAADPCALPEPDTGLVEVHHQADRSVKVVHGLHCLGRIVSVPADERAYMSPVLLLDMRIVVLLVGS